uniref:ribosomal protein L9 n=1 Tax=Ahnfeltia fastigiata TaxID=31363 RepID=UPI001D118DB6|nr:ribosomal protein L9 [Ahnfeltia fastigiata]UAT97633.1 ribosomal protein L9 [Ahnfeltia fastigiata]UAT97837.1 ribosomal protein L9 [Ahnfeltia fastigiata]
MKKNIEVIIKKTTPHLGDIGEFTKVALGYAHNYLIPNKIVEIATPGKLKNAKMFKLIRDKKIEEIKLKAYEVKSHLEKIQKISIKKKIGDHQQIFGSVTEKEIIEQILLYTGENIEKKQIQIPEIKEIGIYTMMITIIDQVTVTLKLQILPDNI